MKLLKWLLIIIGVIVGIVLIYGVTQPSQMQIEESIVIDAPATMVFAEIEDFEAWDEWSAWSKMDPDMDQTYEGEIGKVGYKNAWVSENPIVGTGSQEVVEIRENEFMKTRMLFNGEQTENFASFKLTEEEGKTTVVWDMLGGETPFYARIMNTIFRPMIVESYKSSLKDLKTLVESKPVMVPNPLGLQVVQVEGVNMISILDSTTVADMPNKMTEVYMELGIFMGMNNVISTGNSFSYYHEYTPEKVIFEPGFPVEGEVKGNDRIKVGKTHNGKALKAVYVGDYEGLTAVHMGIEAYSKASNLELEPYCWEEYLNMPGEVDNAELETHVYYPIKE